MRNTLFVVVFVFAAGQICHVGLPWWGVVVPIGAVAGWLFPLQPWRSWLAGFLGGFLLWAAYALILDISNDGILSARIGKLFMGLPRWGVLALTGLLGGLLAGFGSLTGNLARAAFQKK
ncbi:MAG: hypothetical protein ABMA02_04100 [Saprospiraceae bacterium]